MITPEGQINTPGEQTEGGPETLRPPEQAVSSGLNIAEIYFGGLDEAIKARIEELSEKKADQTGRELPEENFRREAAEKVLGERRQRVVEVLKGLRKKTEPLNDEEKKALHQAQLIVDGGVHTLCLLVKTGAADEISKALINLESAPDDIDGLDEGKKAGELIDNNERDIPEASQLAVLAADEEITKGLQGEETSFFGKKTAELIEYAAERITGRRPTFQELTAEKGLDLKMVAKERIRETCQRRAQRIIDNYVLKVNEELTQKYIDKDNTINSSDFEKAIEGAKREEEELIRDIEERLRYINEREREFVVSGKFDEKMWKKRAAWRKFVRDALPDFEGNHGIMFENGTPAGAQFTDLVTKRIDMEEILEPLGVRQAIVSLYPKLKRGEFFFGRAGEIFVIHRGQVQRLKEIPQAKLSKYGIEETIECQIALEVLRAWLVHPDRENNVAWNIYANDHDGVARWYPAKKWGETEGDLLRRALGREVLVEPGNGSGNYWEVMMKDEKGNSLDIAELVNSWEKVKERARQQGGLNLTGFYDRARKIVEAANAIHELVTSGISPENVVKIIIEEERFKYLGKEGMNKAWTALYTEAWKMLLERTPITSGQEKLKNIALLRNLYALRKISESQLNELLALVEQVPEIESLLQRILSLEGQILERGYSIFVFFIAALESFPVVNQLASLLSFGILTPRWDPKTQESDQFFVRRLGINPFSAEVAAAGLMGYLIPHVIAGSFSWQEFWPAFLGANAVAVILTNITDYLNEKRKLPFFQTQMSYKEWPLKQGNPGGAVLAPLVFIPSLFIELFKGVRARFQRKIEEPTSISRKKFLKTVGVLTLASFFGGLFRGTAEEKENLKKKIEKEKALNALPESQQKELKRREEAEKKSRVYQLYKDGSYTLNPFNIEDEMVKDLVKTVGPTWMFEEERKEDLEKWCGRKFDSNEIFNYRTNPQLLRPLLEELQKQGKISEEVVQFYMEALKDWEKQWSSLDK